MILTKKRRPYPSDVAKCHIDFTGGWVDLKRNPLTLCCNEMYTFSKNRERRLKLS